MDDLELLELAAKACGYKYSDYVFAGETRLKVINGRHMVSWNPLEDDGDALRLAVVCELFVDTQYNMGSAVGHASFSCEDFWEGWGDDAFAATRRAIVRAAAEIGKRIK